MLKGIILTLHIIVSLSLIAVVLLQAGKAAGLGTIAGGAQQLFGKTRGIDELLGRATIYVAAGFMLTSILLTLLSG